VLHHTLFYCLSILYVMGSIPKFASKLKINKTCQFTPRRNKNHLPQCPSCISAILQTLGNIVNIIFNKQNIYSACSFQLRLFTSHCRLHFKCTDTTLLVSIKVSAVLWDWSCKKGSFYDLRLFKYFLASLQLTITFGTFKSH
jgi:hypothetical protein